MDVEIGPVTFASAMYTKAILRAYLEYNTGGEKDVRKSDWSGYPSLDGM